MVFSILPWTLEFRRKRENLRKECGVVILNAQMNYFSLAREHGDKFFNY